MKTVKGTEKSHHDSMMRLLMRLLSFLVVSRSAQGSSEIEEAGRAKPGYSLGNLGKSGGRGGI